MRTELALYRRFTAALPGGALSSGRMPGGEAVTIPAVVRELERVHGSPSAAARAAGVPRSTWGHIKRGRRPSAANLGRLRDAQRAWRMRHAAVFRTAPGIVLHARVDISSDHRTRPLQVGRWTDGFARRRFDAVQPAMVDAWLAGDDARAARLFESVVEQALGLIPGTFAMHVDVRDVRFFASDSAADTYARSVGTTVHRD